MRRSVPPALIALAVAAAGHAHGAVGVSEQDLKAKVAYCETCHGPSAQGFRGFYPIPRLAGQQPEYLKNQLEAFAQHRRTNNIMFNVAHTLSPAMLTALTTFFQNLDPKPLGGAAKELIPAGMKIYKDGIPDADIPPCASCHGPDAKGDGQFPRLAGQLHDYIFNKLTNWTKERGQDPNNPDPSTIMEPIAHGLKEQQIQAIAAYVSSLE